MPTQNITCHFCFEVFEVFLEADPSFNGQTNEIYDCEVCCNPNKIHYEVYEGQITITQVTDGNE